MSTIHKVVTAVGLPSGEEADWSFWLDAELMADAIGFVEGFCTYLAAEAQWKAIFPATVTFGTPKISTVDQATGEVLATSQHGAAYGGSGLGGALPPQCSIVATLRTALAGKSDTGRFYLPGPAAVNIDANGRLLTTEQGYAAAHLVGAFEAGSSAVPGISAVVYSRTHRTTHQVEQVDVGNVIDTQRRRRDRLVESRVVYDIAWV